MKILRNITAALLGFGAGIVSAAPVVQSDAAQTPVDQQRTDERRAEGAASGVGDTRSELGRPSPGSLWTGFEPHVDWVSDLRARSIGDLVTIRIVESVSARQNADTETDRSTEISGGIAQLFGLQNIAPDDLQLDQLLGASSSSRFSGSGGNTRTNSLNTTITATVTEILPNGNLVVEASRFVKVNEEEERLTLRGVIRRYDIGATNDVLSTDVADVQIHYGGKGVIGSNLKPGFLFRLIRFIF